MNPVRAALEKMAAKEMRRVRAHTRVQEGKLVQVDAYVREEDVAEAEVDLAEKKDVELELWRKWKAGGEKEEDLRPLLKSLTPLIQSKAYVFKSGKIRISPAAIDAEFYKQTINALRSYNPEKGKLGTYLYKYLDKAKRFITQNQNIARIPEHRVYKINEFQVAQEMLEAAHGRPATDMELAGYLKWTVPEVARMAVELRKDLWTHTFEEDPSAISVEKDEEILKYIRYDLSEDEKKVFDVLRKGERSTSTIAKKVGFNVYKVSRIRKGIAKKVEKYL